MASEKEFLELAQAYQRLLNVGNAMRERFQYNECLNLIVDNYPPDNTVATPCGTCENCLAVQAWDAVILDPMPEPQDKPKIVRTLHVKGTDYWGDGADNTLAVNFDLMSDSTVRWSRTNLGGWSE